MDVGVSSKKLYGTASPVEEKNRIIYPSLRIEKDIGDFEIEQKVNLSCVAVVTSLRKEKDRTTVEFEIHELSIGKSSRKELGEKVAEEFLAKEG